MFFVARFVILYLVSGVFTCVYGEEVFAFVCNTDSSVQVQKVCKEETNSCKKLMPGNESLYHRYPIYSEYSETKYFHESYFNRYCDQRYITKGAGETSDERIAIRKNLLLEWFHFTKDQNLLFWLAHESLLGWYWQRASVPWDHVPSVQVLYFDLLRFYTPLNGCLYKERYLLDINPNAEVRVHQKHNTIDARFIDTLNGYYLDLTAIAYDGVGFHAKSHHSYSTDAIFPLRRTSFHGTQVWVPNDNIRVLEDEFGSTRLRRRRAHPLGKGISYSFNATAHTWHQDIKKVNLQWT